MPTEQESEAAIDAVVAATRAGGVSGITGEFGAPHSTVGTPAEQIADGMHHAAGSVEAAVAAGAVHSAPTSPEVIDALQAFSAHGTGEAAQILHDAREALVDAPNQGSHGELLNGAPAAPLEPGWMTTKAEDHSADNITLADMSRQLNVDGAIAGTAAAVEHAIQGMPEYHNASGGASHGNEVTDQVRDAMDDLRRMDAAEETLKLDITVHDMANGAVVVSAHADGDGHDSNQHDVIDATHHEEVHSTTSAADAAPEHHSIDE